MPLRSLLDRSANVLVSGVQDELRAYYEAEAQLRLRRPPRGRRIKVRDDFLGLLRQEGRSSVVDFGAGPGGDGGAFTAAGHRYHGVDLAHGNCRLAADAGLTVVQGSISALPFKPDSIEAGWSMSTLMHVPDDEVADVVAAMAIPLEPDAPLLVGLWGSQRDTTTYGTDLEGHRRLFSLRPVGHNRQLLATIGEIEHAASWPVQETGSQYQIFRVRFRARPTLSEFDQSPAGPPSMQP